RVVHGASQSGAKGSARSGRAGVTGAFARPAQHARLAEHQRRSDRERAGDQSRSRIDRLAEADGWRLPGAVLAREGKTQSPPADESVRQYRGREPDVWLGFGSR